MSADSGTGKKSAEISARDRLHAVPVVDLRPVIAPPPEASAEAATPAPREADPEPAATREPGGGWLVPFLAGVVAGAGGFYAVLWFLALI